MRIIISFAPPVGERSKCCGTMADRMLFRSTMAKGPPGFKAGKINLLKTYKDQRYGGLPAYRQLD